jgi:hypothetical protein
MFSDIIAGVTIDKGTIFDIYSKIYAVANATDKSIYISKGENFTLDFPDKGIKQISLNKSIIAVLAGANAIYYAKPVATDKEGEGENSFPNKNTKFNRLILPINIGSVSSIYANNQCILLVAQNKVNHKSELLSIGFDPKSSHGQGDKFKVGKVLRCNYPE